MSATSVGIIFQGSTITLDTGGGAASVGVIVDFEIPANVFKEFRVDGMGDTRELYKRSTKQVGQIFTLTVRYDTKTTAIANNATGTFLITLPKQDSSSPQENTYSFDGYVLEAGPLAGGQDDADGVTQTFTIRLDSEITPTAES
tara:strand:- start:909 stop:1340 length:432 start_codon:yes stop_codon:yes gene_type:complete